MLGIAIYIWIRFEWQFGVGALVTLFHDVSMTLGFFALTQLEFDLNVVAAILTIDRLFAQRHVVIYDRIRENLRKYRKMEIVPLLNLSLNETLSRTDRRPTSRSCSRSARCCCSGPDVIFGFTIAIFCRHLRRHLFVDLHLLADPGLAEGDVGQLPAQGPGRAASAARAAQRKR